MFSRHSTHKKFNDACIYLGLDLGIVDKSRKMQHYFTHKTIYTFISNTYMGRIMCHILLLGPLNFVFEKKVKE